MMTRHTYWPRDRESIKGAKIDSSVAKRVFRFAAPYNKQVVGFLITVVLQAVLGLVPPLIFASIIDTAVIPKDHGRLLVLSAIIVVAAFAQGLVGLAERFWSSHIGEGVIYDLRVQLFDHVQKLPLVFFTRTQTGALTNRLNSDVIGAQRALTTTLGTVVSNVITLATTLVAMFYLEWRLTLLALLLAPLFIMPYRYIGAVQQAITRDSMDLNGSMNATMTERFNVAGASLVKLFGRGDDELAQFSDRAGQVRDIGIRSALFTRGFMTMLSLLGALGTALVYGLGGRFAIDGSLSVGDLAAMGLLVRLVYIPLTGLTNARVDVLTALVSFDRVFEILDSPSPIADKPDAVELTSPKGAVEFDHVRFSYPTASELIVPGLETVPKSEQGAEVKVDEPVVVLHDINFRVAPGATVAVVGPSGAGKTTLTSLIPRLYDATSGRVVVDGFDVTDLSQESLRASIGVVSQDPHLFHESIGDNLRYADPDATEEQILQACEAAQIRSLVESLPNGLETIVGDRGYRMSGGEKQRLAIARVLLKDPSIIILDEATSHLDSENEELVQAALAEALSGRTAFVIAHRLSTIVNADQILVLEAGRIVEKGTHTELLATGQLYSELYGRLVNNNS